MDLVPHRIPRSKAVTLKDIAEVCGVSKQTVSRALLRDPQISRATTERICAVAAEMGYDPLRHQAARRMALGKHGQDIINQVVALFFPPSSRRSHYHTDIFWGVWEALIEAGYGLLIVPNGTPATTEPPTIPLGVRRGDVDGAIVLAVPNAFAPVLTQLREEPLFGARPVVFLVDPPPEISAVLTDDYTGAYQAAAHLLDLGHRQIVQFYTAEMHLYTSRQRLAGYQQACRDHGLDPADGLHTCLVGSFTIDSQLAEFLDWLKAHPHVTAILAPNDFSAIRLARALQRGGWRIPEDISLVGFDDTDPFFDDCGKNILTTVRLPLVELGAEAARLAIKRITGEVTEETRLVLPAEFILRASTAPPRA